MKALLLLSCSSWISGSFTLTKCSSILQFSPSSSSSSLNSCCKFEIPTSSPNHKFMLHDALDSSGINTTHARAARIGFCSEIKKLSGLEKERSISINKGVDLGRAALYIGAEDDSLVSHSSVPLPVEDFIERLDNLSMGYCSRYASSVISPENFLECLERYLYIDKGFRRTSSRNQVEQRALYLHSVLTHRSGSASVLSLIYSKILTSLRSCGVVDFDVEVSFPRDSQSFPKGYLKQRAKESDESRMIMTSESLLVEMLKDLKNAFWPFQRDHTRSPFLRAARAGSNNIEESAWELASAKAAQHRLERGVWTTVQFGDMRRALSACERLVLLETDPKDLRDYSILLYHCGFYKESLEYLNLYQDIKRVSSSLSNVEEEDEVEKLMIRLNLILMDDGWSSTIDNTSFLFKNSEPW